MQKLIKFISVIMAFLMISLTLCACSSDDRSKSGDDFYIKVGDTKLAKEYIGYFFYVAQKNMIEEAGIKLGEGGNSTADDVAAFWETTEIEGRSAVDVARDLAADNAVIQTVQYLKAVQEGIKLTAEEEKAISDNINANIESVGGRDKFNAQLLSMGCDVNAYRQILTENSYVQKLYDKYDSDGKLSVSDDELGTYTEKYASELPTELVFEYAKKDKFNKLALSWEKEYDIDISDEMMKEFKVK